MAENRTSSPLEELKNLLEDLQAKKPLDDLRLPTERTRRALLQLDFTPREPDLKTMERHLRAVYREQLADLFEKACRRLLFEDEVLASEIYDDGKPGTAPIPVSEWESKARRILEVIPEGALEDEPLQTVRLLLDRERLSMTEVARVGKALRPLPAFDIFVGLDALARRQFQEAQRILLRAYENSPFESARRDAICNLGAVANLQGDVALALLRYKEDGESGQPWIMSPVHWLYNAIYLGDLAESQRASEALAERPLGTKLMTDYVRRMRAANYGATWSTNSDSMRVIRSSQLADSEEVDHVKKLFI